MKDQYSQGKRCKHCGKPITNASRTGSCKHCRMTIDQCGSGNPMFGKKLSDETKEKISLVFKKKWKEDTEYRRKVIANATGLKRSEEFRKGQSIRTKESYNKIEGLREKRGKLFSECWKDGRNKTHFFRNKKSGIEKSLADAIRSWGYDVETNAKIIVGKITRGNGGVLFPDIVVNGKVVVEFYGDYFHGNPSIFNEGDIIGFRQRADEKWSKDRFREYLIRSNGYELFIVWEKDLKESREETLKHLKDHLSNAIKKGEGK